MQLKRFVIAAVVLLAGSGCANADSQAELQKFQGDWVMVSAEMDGKAVGDADVQSSRITFAGDKVEMIAPHQHNGTIKASISRIDVTATPMQMHWVRSEGPNAGTTMMAVYEFEGPDQYRISFDPAGATVPKEFRTAAGSGHIRQTWRRVK